MRLDDLNKLAATVVVVGAALEVLRRWAVLPVIRGFRKLVKMADDFMGNEDHPGVLVRLSRVEAQGRETVAGVAEIKASQDDHVATWHTPVSTNGGYPTPTGRHHQGRRP